jgi:hypothetical protein
LERLDGWPGGRAHVNSGQQVSRAAVASGKRRVRGHVPRQGGSDMAKFIQICASQDDLFALDEEGHVYQYNFQAKTWVKLVSGRSQESAACR